MWFIKKKTRLEKQLDEYLEFCEKKGGIATTYERPLREFVDRCEKETVGDISILDVEEYLLEIKGMLSPYQYYRVAVSIRSFVRYFNGQKMKKLPMSVKDEIKQLPLNQLESYDRVRSNMQLVKRNKGRPVNIERIKLVKRLKDKEGMTLKEIAKVVRRSESAVCRSYNYPLNKYLRNEVLQ